MNQHHHPAEVGAKPDRASGGQPAPPEGQPPEGGGAAREALIETIRGRLRDISPGDWRLASDREGRFVEAKTRRGMLLRIADFDPAASDAEMEFCAAAPEMVAYLLGRLDAAVRYFRQGGQPAVGGAQAANAKNHAAEAAMKCEDHRFIDWLAREHGLEPPLTPERAAQKLRSLLGVVSRRELNDNAAAQAAWKALRDQYEADRRAQ